MMYLNMLRVLFLMSHILSFAVCQYKIEFDPANSPPILIPLDARDFIFSVPLNQMISKPIIVYVRFTNGSVVTRGPLSSEYYDVSTVDAKKAIFSQIPDVWADSGGKLCQRSAWNLDYPKRLNRINHKHRCGSSTSPTMLKVPAFNGKLIIDWIYHKHDRIPENNRLLRVELPSMRLTANSNEFKITASADHLTITQEPPKSVVANHDFTVSAEIRFENESVVETGLDSVLNVDLTIPYYFKTFSNKLEDRMIVKTARYRLSGAGATIRQGNYDLIIRKQAVRGKVVFDGVRVLDIGTGIKLNLTMTMSRDPWVRVPYCDTCYPDAKTVITKGDVITYAVPHDSLLKSLKSVKLTQAFDVKEQKLYKLVFSNYTRKFFSDNLDIPTNMLHITRNIIIPGKLSVAATDAFGKRIFSGADSSFSLTYRTVPKDVCITVDSTKQVTGGYGDLFISICTAIENVTLEIVPSVQPNASIKTPTLKVEGRINIAHFGDFSYSGDGNTIESHINSFIRFAANDINAGLAMPSLKAQGIEFNIFSYDTKSDTDTAYKYMINMEKQQLPKDRVTLLISSSTEEISKSITSVLWQIGTAFYSTTDTDSEFSNKDSYPLSNRLCWPDIETFKNMIRTCLDRMWTEIVILLESTIHFTEEYYHESHELGMEIKGVVTFNVDSIIPGKITHFTDEFKKVRSFATKIIILIANRELQLYILRAAQLANMDALHGYQWLSYSSYAWQFPFTNEGVCREGVLCTDAFTSMYLFSETYNITGYHTKDWIRVLRHHFSADRFNYKGGRVSYRTPAIGGKLGLAYDAVILFSKVLQKILESKERITAQKIAALSRNMYIDGLTGRFKLNSDGDRSGFFGFLAQVNPLVKGQAVADNILKVITFNRVIIKKSDDTLLEIPYMVFMRSSQGSNYESNFTLPISTKYNLRTFLSVSGVVGVFNQSISKNPTEPWPSVPYNRTEYVAPIFTCSFPCGQKLLSPKDVNVYDTGKCHTSGRCNCNPGFHGNFCRQISCECEYGICKTALYCDCYEGWKGDMCNVAICDACYHGKCTQPDTCECNSKLWIGNACETHIGVVVGPLLLGTAIIGVLITLLVKYILKHAERNAALSNNDWIVDWAYVTQYVSDDTAGSKTSLSEFSSLISQKDIHAFWWKDEKWYGKPISSRTVDPKIPEMRLEMVELVKIRHRNLIKYGGACLTSPNVCLFLEVADKGSLNDILLNSSIDLSWEFRFSFLKDICAGMRFLHEKTAIGSHGRLKSHNCLIDSRWTVRISGFGAYTIRFGRYRLPPEVKEELKDLFWTAPELLENVTCLDDVKNGTLSGDTYSFAIVAAEITTRGEPYQYELESISQKAIFDMITDNNSWDRKNATQKWEDMGGASMFICRPIIRDECYPESGLQKKQFIKMLEAAWSENPSARPNFEKLIGIFNQIHPVKGELIDNLSNLLQSYSTNLEMIVVERTKELEVNKARAEQLLSQMLPQKVIVEIKQGRKVPPEIFSTATIFFSDIVDFQKICQESTAFQIVDFLNETYNVFDEILNSHDVYKVETISDSYMVVSGVPETNGLRHASEIATLALDLMSCVTTFQIPHKPKATLQLRVGMHSGPVVAGVVGMLMPRYCLFGDTVNTASRMESSSQALCIQVSESTAKILDKLGGFDLECRGQMEVKGRGLMTTYWLWGKDNFDKPMPDQSLALSLSQHKFK